VIWLLRHLKPDFKTIADFRRDNRHAFRAIFRQFVLLCRQLDLFGRELLAVDGTRISMAALAIDENALEPALRTLSALGAITRSADGDTVKKTETIVFEP
jgi:hypothetical protein